MKKSTVVLIGIAIFGLISCKKNKDVSRTTEGTKTEEVAMNQSQQRLPAVMPIDVNKDYAWPGQTDAFQIADAQIEGDKLVVKVTYGGGCKEHGFYLHNNAAWAKSLPPKTDLYLEHVSNGDNCRAFLEQTLTYDLTPLRYPGQNQVKLSLKNGVDTKDLVYKY